MSSRAQLKDRTFLKIAIDLGQLGTCSRGHVGALIVKEGRCVTWGFNGAPPGLPHCEENQHGWQSHFDSWKLEEEYIGRPQDEWQERFDKYIQANGCSNAIHAEANALAFAAREGISTDGGTCYTECVPCVNCARLLIAAGIKRVVAAREYRDPDGLELLQSAKVSVLVVSWDEPMREANMVGRS